MTQQRPEPQTRRPPRYRDATDGSPYAPHTTAETRRMLDAVGVDAEDDLFDIPSSVWFDDDFDIPSRTEAELREEIRGILETNDDVVELLGRGHHSYYVPSVVDHLADRSEFLTSYTQYQPEVTQGFLQALFEYQSMIAELTGLGVVNCSMYDAATALGETATFADRIRSTSGNRVLVPEHLRDGRRAVLENYVAGADLVVDSYPMTDGNADVDAVHDDVDDDVVLVYAETPTVRGCVEEHASTLGDVAHEHDALFALGSDPVSLSLLESPAAVGADVVVGDASVLGLPTSYGMGLGLFATREDYLRQVPGRLVGASEDDAGTRAYTLTLQTREQHIRKERATSNICTNQAWVALRTAMHAASLGPEGLVDLAESGLTRARRISDRLDAVDGVTAPVHDRHHLGEFVFRTDRPAADVAADLESAGFAVHALDGHELQVRVAGVAANVLDDFVATLGEVAR